MQDLGAFGVEGFDRAVVQRTAVSLALKEDLGTGGDLTSRVTVPEGRIGSAHIVPRRDGIIAGLEVAAEVFIQVDESIAIERHYSDGEPVGSGDVVAQVRGSLRSILAAERVALNFLGHLSGVATQTRRFVDAVQGTGVFVRDTRKTTPGLRWLEKDAVLSGGGANHRVGLYDELLVKDNHIAAAGAVAPATRQALEGAGELHVQVEVDGVAELEEALAAGATDILLDNFAPDDVRAAVRQVDGRARLEASGTITLANIRDYALTGVDRISCGALTHSAPWLDVGLDVVSVSKR